MTHGLPRAYPGMKIGLFGGSFDPAHEGHAHVANTALKRLQLDRVWWLVSPQNPLKPKSSPFAQRLRSAQAMARGPHMIVSDFEQRFGCAYTYKTIRLVRRLYPGVRFTLVMGADNLIHFRKWRHWREVAKALPVAVISRPLVPPSARLSAPKNWTFINARHHPHSSSAQRLRAAVAKAPRK